MSIFRQFYRIVGVTFNKRYVVPLMHIQHLNIVNKAPIKVNELNELHGKTEEQQGKIVNSEILASGVTSLKEELQ